MASNNQYILSLDEGTTSVRAILFDKDSNVVEVVQQALSRSLPKDGWVEQDALEILDKQMDVAREVLIRTGTAPTQIAAIGITNQRETTVVWDKHTGKPVYNAIVWQDRRTAVYCDELKEQGLEAYVKEVTGLVLDPYFSGTKLKWILDHIATNNLDIDVRDLCFGTIDSWLIWHMTGGKVHATDYSNASRTLLYNIDDLDWDEKMLKRLDIPRAILPDVRPSSGDFGMTDPLWFDGVQIPIRGVAGDQQAALFGQACFDPGMSKNTYGTGCFMLMNTGTKRVASANGLLTTLAWGLNGEVNYALEGSIFVAGAAIQWLRDSLKFIDAAQDSEYYAGKVPGSEGVYVVPAFAGLGAPWWDPYARGAIFGMTLGTTKAHIVRATLESLAYQTSDVLNAMEEDAGQSLKALRVDGGAAANDLLMQFQADMLDVPVERPSVIETTALGAAYLAGLAVGYWDSLDELRAAWNLDQRFEPAMEDEERNSRYTGWHEAVKRTRGWAKPA